jgi:hypothetical protein
LSRRALSLLLAGATMLLVGCGGGNSTESGTSEPRQARGSLASYLAEAEPIRDGVNRLLDGADPILDAYREHRIGAAIPDRDFDELR